MKTTLEIPDNLLKQAQVAAAKRGIPLPQLISEALSDKLSVQGGDDASWTVLFGQLSNLHEQTVIVDQIIETEFNRIEAEDWK